MRRWIAALGIVAAASCSGPDTDSASNATPRRSLPQSNGTHHDLTLVCSNDLWTEEVGMAVAEILGAPVAGLPQAEPRFGVARVDPERVNDLLRRGKSLLYISVIPDSSAVLQVRDAFAAPQLVIQVVAPNAADLPKILRRVLPELGDRFAAHDLDVLAARMRSGAQDPLPGAVRDLGVQRMMLPEGFTVTLRKPGMVVLRRETKKSQQYVVLTRSNADDSPTPEADVIKDRDALLRTYFEGPDAKSHLATELLVPPVQLFYTAQDGNRALRTAGLFKTVGGFGGGSFISHRVYDDARGAVGTADALLFAPGAKKRKMMMELELVTRSVRWGDPR